ncbi:MAG: cysteine--tRNA ligase, partial [Oscillospiraceae bacterium]
MKIYNTLTRQKEELKTVKPNTVKIYVCGPTVYNYIHVGNARPICVFDTLRRYLEYKGYNVEYVQNFTDVDDKIIKRANEENVSYSEIPERYIKEFLVDTKGLNVKAPTYAPKVSENMNEIITLVQTLIDKGHAYAVGNDVYFRTKSFDQYGKLSHMPLEELEAGARIEVSSVKEDPMDFALWKGAKPNEPSWEAPFGNGRPGWHIECSAMAKRFLGDTIDIHCGGQDLVFPHHENEIAQSECANGVCFSHYWMHNAYINIDNKKMSKSLNNFFTTREIANKYGYEPIRFLMIQSHYRSQINFTSEVIEACIASLQRLYNCKDALNRVSDFGQYNDSAKLEEYFNSFINALDDDF